MNTIRSPALAHPERIHPALWRGSQLAQARQTTVPTGFDSLDRELPNQGWPTGTLIELIPVRPGIGEMQLLRPAFGLLDHERCIALVNPPYIPYFHCWLNWQLDGHCPIWIQAKNTSDSLWSAEQILKYQACSALLCWTTHIRPQALRRLQLLAQQSDTLFLMFRPPVAALQASAAPLRLGLKPSRQGLAVSILKRRGPLCPVPVLIPLYSSHFQMAAPASHAPLDQYLPAHTQPRRAFSPLAN